MGSRRSGRELCLQALYLVDICGHPPNEAWRAAKTIRQSSSDNDEDELQPPWSKPAKEYGETLFQGVVKSRDDLDAAISRHCRNWSLARMSAVDRNILRIGAFEILNSSDVPPAAAINEAIEIAKLYSTQESGGFVNGILDQLKTERPASPTTSPAT